MAEKRKNTLRFTTDDDLSVQHSLFVQEYLKDFRGGDAAIRAGYSERSAAPTASRLLQEPRIQAAIAKAVGSMLDKFQITNERVLAEYARMAFSDLGDVIEIDDDGTATVNLALIKNNKDARAAIAEINQSDIKLGKDGEGGVERRTRIKMHDKKGALDALAKYLRLMPSERVEVTGKDGAPFEAKLTVDLSGLSVEELEALNAAAAKVKKAEG
ncbi:terminase small subunit (plasmid) [Azospirillum sp. HJ39]|uniref:terminase small subunit n=1 Tax=Azospirillum sp. HJ39 TaxID=3159496 RepID=UPI003557A9F4